MRRLSLLPLLLLMACSAAGSESAAGSSSDVTTATATRLVDARTAPRFFRNYGADPTPAIDVGHGRAFFTGTKTVASAEGTNGVTKQTWLYETKGTAATTRAFVQLDGELRGPPVALDGTLYFITSRIVPGGSVVHFARTTSTGVAEVAFDGEVSQLVAGERAVYVRSTKDLGGGRYAHRVSRLVHDASGAPSFSLVDEVQTSSRWTGMSVAAGERGVIIAREKTITLATGFSSAIVVATEHAASAVYAFGARFFYTELVGGQVQLFEVLGDASPRVRGYGALPDAPLSAALVGETPVFFTKRKIALADTGLGSIVTAPADLTEAPATAVVGSTLYALTDHGDLYATNGTAAGTKRVRDGLDWLDGVGKVDLVEKDGALYFFTPDVDHGTQLVRRDVATGAETFLTSFPRNARFENLREVGSNLVFGAGGTAKELWTWNGSAAAMIETNPYSNSSARPRIVAKSEDRVFVRTDDDDDRSTLWVTDGTPAGTRSIATGTFTIGSDSWASASGDRICILELEPQLKSHWLCTNGTAAGTTRIPGGYLKAPAVFRGGFYLTGDDGAGGVDFLRVDASTGAVTKLRSLHADAGLVDMVARSSDVLILTRSRTATAEGIWTTDGTAAGTIRMVPTAPFLGSYGVQLYGVAGETAYYCADGLLYATDGTATGTAKRAALVDGCRNYPSGGAIGGAFLLPDDGKLLRFEGSRVETLSTSLGDYYYEGIPSGRELVFGSSNSGILVTDGTAAGTHLVPGSVTQLVSLPGGGVIGASYDGPSPLLLRDGAATVLEPTKSVGTRSNLCAVPGGIVFASAFDGHGVELAFTDGSVGGTRLAAEIVPGALSSIPSQLTMVGRSVVFTAKDANGDEELYAVPATF
ncbi:MAG: hypothetical protein U0270_31345 [Labilithrix sp.]